jgi:hypothetical protein
MTALAALNERIGALQEMVDAAPEASTPPVLADTVEPAALSALAKHFSKAA